MVQIRGFEKRFCPPPNPLPSLRAFGASNWDAEREREYVIDNLLVRIHLIIEMILVD